MKVSGILVVAVSAAVILSMLSVTVNEPSGIWDIVSFSDKPVISEASARILPVEINELYRAKGFAGDGAMNSYHMQVFENYIDDTKHCEFCTMVVYTPGGREVSAFSFRDDSGYDLTGTKRAKFLIMGERGGESVSVKVAGKVTRGSGVVDELFKNLQFASTTESITLGDEWRTIEIDLQGRDLRNITDPIGFEVKKGRDLQPVVFYIKQVIFDAESPENPVRTRD